MSAGKGSRPRPIRLSAYQKNYERVFGKHKAPIILVVDEVKEMTPDVWNALAKLSK